MTKNTKSTKKPTLRDLSVKTKKSARIKGGEGSTADSGGSTASGSTAGSTSGIYGSTGRTRPVPNTGG